MNFNDRRIPGLYFKFYLSAICLFCTIATGFAQNDFVKNTSALIAARNFDEAAAQVDALLKKEPRNIDAKMMQGNVILNRAYSNAPKLFFNSKRAEDVFDTASTIESMTTVIVDKKTSETVEKIWKECLSLDPERKDIRKGLCNLYSISLRKEETKEQIKWFLSRDSTNEELPFLLADYARNFKARGRFDDAAELYRYIGSFRPLEAGILVDLGSEYYYQGRMEEALNTLDEATRRPKMDEVSYLNSAMVYSLLSYTENALQIFNAYDTAMHTHMGSFYKALILFQDSADAWPDSVLHFMRLTAANQASYDNEYRLCNYLLENNAQFTMAKYKTIINSDLPDAYKTLIHTRAIRQFNQSCDAWIAFGIQQASIKNYAYAAQLLAEGERCPLPPALAENWMFYYAICLWNTDHKKEAVPMLRQLKEAKQAWFRHAAQYFIAVDLMNHHLPTEAEEALYLLNKSTPVDRFTQLAGARTEESK